MDEGNIITAVVGGMVGGALWQLARTLVTRDRLTFRTRQLVVEHPSESDDRWALVMRPGKRCEYVDDRGRCFMGHGHEGPHHLPVTEVEL